MFFIKAILIYTYELEGYPPDQVRQQIGFGLQALFKGLLPNINCLVFSHQRRPLDTGANPLVGAVFLCINRHFQ